MNTTDPSDPFTWELPPANAEALPKGLAFGLPQEPADQDMPVWRIDFPADMQQAASQIEQAQRQVAARQSRLEALPAQFDRLALQAKAPVSGTSFAAPEATSAEAELLADLAQLSDVSTKGALSFGLAERLGGGWEQVNAQFQAFADRLQRTLAHLAWVETRQAGRLIGQTVVGWSGDCNTVWGASVSPEQMDLHRRSLETALQSRIVMLSTFTMAVQGAVKLSVYLTTPGGIILALPTVWKYVNQVLALI